VLTYSEVLWNANAVSLFCAIVGGVILIVVAELIFGANEWRDK
jgi:uncharacterized membrane protein YeaQ/YmgE (transglycosylase-associated protein family)